MRQGKNLTRRSGTQQCAGSKCCGYDVLFGRIVLLGVVHGFLFGASGRQGLLLQDTRGHDRGDVGRCGPAQGHFAAQACQWVEPAPGIIDLIQAVGSAWQPTKKKKKYFFL